MISWKYKSLLLLMFATQMNLSVMTPETRAVKSIQFKCQICDYKSDRKSNLLRHIKKMHETCKPKTCCSLAFHTKWDLIVHINNKHSKGYRCEECDPTRTFVRKALLMRHISVHSGVRPHKCSHCPYASSNRCNVKRHERAVHTPLEPQPVPQPQRTRLCVYPYKCWICKTKFTSQYEIETHCSTLNEVEDDVLSAANILTQLKYNSFTQ